MAERTADRQKEIDFNRAAFAAALTEKIGPTRFPIIRVLLAWFDARLGRAEFHPSVSEIARAGRVSAQTVRRALAELATLAQPGITIDRQRKPDGSWMPVQITIQPALFDRSTEGGGVLPPKGGGTTTKPVEVPPRRYLHGGTSTAHIVRSHESLIGITNTKKAHETHEHEKDEPCAKTGKEPGKEPQIEPEPGTGRWWGFAHPLTGAQLRDARTRDVLFGYAVARGKRAATETARLEFHALCLCCAQHGRDGGGRLLTACVLSGRVRYGPSDRHYDQARVELIALGRQQAARPAQATQRAAARLAAEAQQATRVASREEMAQALERRIAERRRARIAD